MTGTAPKATHKRSPSSWSRVLGIIMAKGRRFWPCNTRSVDPDNYDEKNPGEKTARTKALLDTYNSLCKSTRASESELIHGESTLVGYLDEGLDIGRQLVRSSITHDPDRIFLQRSPTDSNEDYAKLADAFSRDLKSPFHAHYMDYALLIPREEEGEEKMLLIDWRNLKVKQPALASISSNDQLSWRRDIAAKLLAYAREADYETDDVTRMNLDQWTRFIEERKAERAQMKTALMEGAGADHQQQQEVLDGGVDRRPGPPQQPPVSSSSSAYAPPASKKGTRKRKAKTDGADEEAADETSGSKKDTPAARNAAEETRKKRDQLFDTIEKRNRMKEEDREMKLAKEEKLVCWEMLQDSLSWKGGEVASDLVLSEIGVRVESKAVAAIAIFENLPSNEKELIKADLKSAAKNAFSKAFP